MQKNFVKQIKNYWKIRSKYKVAAHSKGNLLYNAFVRNLIVKVSNYDVDLIIKYLAVGFKSMK